MEPGVFSITAVSVNSIVTRLGGTPQRLSPCVTSSVSSRSRILSAEKLIETPASSPALRYSAHCLNAV